MLNKRILVLMFLLVFLPLVGCFPPPTNQAPILTSDPITTATVGVLYTYNVNATDPDDDALTYSLIIKPGGMIINSVTGVIFWTPIAAQIGNNSVTVKVSDGSLSITQSFTIKVSKPSPTPINHAPVIYSTPITTAIVGVTYFYDVNATDPDGDILNYFLTACPGGMTISSASGLIMWTPTVKGNYVVVVNVSDGILSDAQPFTIVVSKPTVPPETYTITSSAGTGGTISPLGDITVNKGANISFYIKPNTNYGIEKVLVDGVSVGTVSTYPFYNVAKDHTIHAIFSAVEPEPNVELIGIEVPPDILDLLKGDSQQLTVTAIYSDGSTLDVTSDCKYQSNDIDIASVDTTGVVKGIGYGRATVTVSYREKIAKTAYIEETDTVEVTVIGPVQNIDTCGYYDTIQLAIDKASDDNTIEVSAGIYDENVTIDVEGLTLKSVVEYGAIIKGNVTVEDDNVVMKGFEVQSLKVHHNGILLEKVSNCIIENNTISGDVHNAITLNGSNNNLITGNTATVQSLIHNTFGMWVQDSDDNEITDNTFSDNKYGIEFHCSTNNEVTGNTFSDNGYGIEFWDSSGNAITSNYFENNEIYVIDLSKNVDLGDLLSKNYFEPEGAVGVHGGYPAIIVI